MIRNVRNLPLRGQQKGVFVIDSNVAWFATITAQTQTIPSILLFLKYWPSAASSRDVYRTRIGLSCLAVLMR